MASADYDGQWTLSVNGSDPNITATIPGVFLGNGKVGVVTSFSNIDVKETMITTQLKYYNGSYRANIIEPFYTNCVKFFDNNDSNVNYSLVSQSLNMYSAIFTCAQLLTSIPTGNVCAIEYDLYTPQQLPFCTMQTFRITPVQSMSELVWFHEVYAKENMTDVEYNNNVILNDNISSTGGSGISVLSGRGRQRTNMRGSATTQSQSYNDYDSVCTACSYMIEMAPDQYDNLGFNVYRSDLNRCYNKFRLKNLVAGTTYRIHIVSAHLTSADFEAPHEEAKRIVLNIINKGADAAAVAARVRTDHTYAWTRQWGTEISVTPKTGISPAETTKLKSLKRTLRYAHYNMYSSVRENINVEVNPLNLSVIDVDGSLLYDGDLWTIPLLIMIKPDVARALLEYRYKLIDTARQLAAGFGYKGAKYPYLNDSVGYKNALYWDVQGPLAVFNTALISINVWNYYRVTTDRDWLRSKGYAIIKDNADFFVSKIDKDIDGTYHLRNVVGINGTESADQNVFTNNMVRLALKYAIEASYELSYAAKDTWQAYFYGLPLKYYPNPDQNVLKSDDASTNTSTYNILEPLFDLLPYYNQLFFAPELGHNMTSVAANINWYKTKMNAGTVNHPFNTALLGILTGLYSQFNTASVNDYEAYVQSFITNNVGTGSVWGALGSKSNDVTLNSVFLMMIVQGMSQLNVFGGVAETRFYYEEMRLAALTSANMPTCWKNVKITGTGANMVTYTTTNSLYYTTPC